MRVLRLGRAATGKGAVPGLRVGLVGSDQKPVRGGLSCSPKPISAMEHSCAAAWNWLGTLHNAMCERNMLHTTIRTRRTSASSSRRLRTSLSGLNLHTGCSRDDEQGDDEPIAVPLWAAGFALHEPERHGGGRQAGPVRQGWDEQAGRRGCFDG